MTVKNVSGNHAPVAAHAEPHPAPPLDQVRSGASLVRQGMRGESVRAVQTALVQKKLLSPADVDGAFGPKTLAAVKRFQAAHGLVQDGLVGRHTIKALEKQSWSPSARTRTGPESSNKPHPAQPAHPAQPTQPAQPAQPAGPTQTTTPAHPEKPSSVTPSTNHPSDLPALQRLSPALRAQLQLVLSGQAGATSQAALTGLLSNPAFQAAPADLQQLTLEAIDPGNVRQSLGALTKLMAVPAFAHASFADMEKLVTLSRLGQTDTLAHLGERVFSKDLAGTRLLDSATQLATGPLQPDLAKDRQGLLTSALADVAHPELMVQRDHNTCAAVTAEQLLVRQSPAELLRLMAGVASPAGTVTLANGQPLTRAAGTEKDDGSGRSSAQRLLQAAFMEYGNGAARYDNAQDKSLQGAQGRMGLTQDEMAHLLSGVTGAKYHARGINQTDGALAHLGLAGVVASNVLSSAGGAFHVTHDELFSALAKRQGPTMVSMLWSTAGHVVMVDRIADGRVYFQNPQGNALPRGGAYADGGPARRSEGGLEQSMSEADFRARLMATIDPG